jgi:CRP/FNR family cyclic AMP-dependent transcriptional regulator
METATDPALLADVHLFRGLSPAELRDISGLLHCRTYPPKAQVISAELPGETAYIVLEGSLKVHTEHRDGRQVILAILGKGEVVGEMSLLDSLTRSATVVTLEESTLLWLDRAAFWECLRRVPALSLNLTSILSRRLRLANAQIHSLASLDVFGRVAHQVLTFADEYGQARDNGDVLIPIRLTQTDLADLTGGSRVRVNQVMAVYKRLRYLSIDRRHHITIHNKAALVQRCR